MVGGCKMAKSQSTSKLDKLMEREKQLKAQIASEKAKIAKEERKLLTRKKILIGSYFLQQYENNMPELIKLLDPFLVRENDRKIFGLPINGKKDAK